MNIGKKIQDGQMMMLGQALNIKKNREYRKMRRIYGVNDERTQMVKKRYLHIQHSEVDL